MDVIKDFIICFVFFYTLFLLFHSEDMIKRFCTSVFLCDRECASGNMCEWCAALNVGKSNKAVLWSDKFNYNIDW